MPAGPRTVKTFFNTVQITALFHARHDCRGRIKKKLSDSCKDLQKTVDFVQARQLQIYTL